MPRYEADPSKVSAGFTIFPKGEYEFIIGEPVPFARDGQKGPNWGIRYVLTCATEGPLKGQKYFQNMYHHTEATGPINKQFMLAAAGFTVKQEKEYNQEVAGADWAYDTDSKSVGDAWRTLTGRRVVADMDVKLDANSNEQQTAVWRPAN